LKVKEIILAFCIVTAVFPAVSEESTPVPLSFTPQKNWAAAVGETLSADLFMYVMDRYVAKESYSQVDADSIHENLTGGWEWDQDLFMINMLGHPYQGIMSYTAGRSNNLNELESFGLALFGSAVWELFPETTVPSYNDLIYTSVGGSMYGEMIHRLFMETTACHPSFLLGIGQFALSPFHTINYYAGNKKYPTVSAADLGNIRLIAFTAEYAAVFERDWSQNGQPDRNYPTSVQSSIDIVYGNPYGLQTLTPYKQFDLYIDGAVGGGSDLYRRLELFNNTFLCSWAPETGENSRTSTGIGLHYDFVYIPTSAFISAFSLGWSTKQLVSFDDTHQLRWQTHFNFVPIGSSEDYEIFYSRKSDPGRNYNLGFGGSFKGQADLLSLDSFQIGMNYYSYLFYEPDVWLAKGAYTGVVWLNRCTLFAERHLSKPLWLGVRGEWYGKNGWYSEYHDTFETTVETSVYLKTRTDRLW
jgi:hypothetical protein